MRRVGVVIILLVGCGVAVAGEAVSEVNAKFDYLGGSMDSSEGHNGAGTFTAPLATNWGIQVDGRFTDVADTDFTGGGVHLFWRDWDKGMVGFAASTVHADHVDAFQWGLEGEYYLDKVTLAARAGIADLEYSGGSRPFIDTDVRKFFVGTEVRGYLLDDLMVSGAWDHLFYNNLLTARFEYLTPIQGLSVLGELARGDHGYDHALLGLRFHLGVNKPLKLRHRQDYVPNSVGRTLYAIGTYGAEYIDAQRDYIEALGGTPSDSSGSMDVDVQYYTGGVSIKLVSATASEFTAGAGDSE